jgi:uncharacterized protein (UPF0548 family)
MIKLGRVSTNTVQAFLEQQTRAGFSYQEIGLTQEATRPSGYFLDSTCVIVGKGHDAFFRARAALKRWAMHNSPILQLKPDGVKLEVGLSVCVQVGIAGIFLLNACQVVYVIDQPRSFGFGYGTLHDHPARGEERFLLEHQENDDVVLSLFAFSKPSSWLYWLGLPVTRLMQTAFTRTYIQNMKRAVQP